MIKKGSWSSRKTIATAIVAALIALAGAFFGLSQETQDSLEDAAGKVVDEKVK